MKAKRKKNPADLTKRNNDARKKEIMTDKSELESLVRNLNPDDFTVTVDGAPCPALSRVLHYYITNNPEVVIESIKSAVKLCIPEEPLYAGWSR